MVLVLALLLTALCGVHSASIPANSLGKLARKSANKLDMPNLDKIRGTVLEDMKRLLDNQLAVLFENAVDQKAGAQRKLLKPKTKLHPTLSTGDTTSNLESHLPDEPQNSDFIKVLTDGSLQDSGDEVLRNAVDQLLQEDEDKTADNYDNSEGLLSNNEDQLKGDNSTKNNSGENIIQDAFDDATLPPSNTNDKDRQKNKINSRKGKSHVIIEHVPKTNKKYDDDKRSENILDLDEILKSALKDISSSLSHEDEYSKADSEDRGLATENLYPKSSQQNESSLEVEGIKNKDTDANTFKIGNDNDDRGENNDNVELETRLNSKIEYENPKTKHHKHTHSDSSNHKAQHNQLINYNDKSEKHTNKRYDIHKEEKNLDKDENDTKELKRGDNEDEVRKHHNEKQHSNEKPKNRHGNSRDHHSKKHHSKHRHNKNHDTHKHHNENKNHDQDANQHIIVRLTSDFDGNNESRLDTLHYKNPIHEKKVERNSRHQNSKETSNHSDRYDLPTLREDSVNVSQYASKDKSILTEIKKSNGNEEENKKFNPDNNFTKEVESFSEEDDDFIQGNKLTKEESYEIGDVTRAVREENKSLETRKGKKEKYRNNEDDIGKEGNENENYVTDEIENITIENKESDIEAKSKNADENDNEDKKNITKQDKHSKKDEIHRCHHERDERIFESGDPNVIRDLIQNKEMKKSYSLSLTLSTK